MPGKNTFFHNGILRIIDVLYGDDDATDCPDSIWGSEEDIPSLGAFVVVLCIDWPCAGHKKCVGRNFMRHPEWPQAHEWLEIVAFIHLYAHTYEVH